MYTVAPAPRHRFVMTNRVIIPLLLCAASVAFARGSTGRRESVTGSEFTREQGKEALAASLAIDGKRGLNFTLNVRNNTKRMLELRFPNGQTHDFFVLDENGKEVWRWSEGKMFTQALQNRLVKSKETVVFANRIDSSKMHGRYTAVAVLTSDNHPVEQRVQFAVR